MKRDRLEILILTFGAIIIIVSLFFRFFSNMSPEKKLLLMNIIFAVGFLAYIIYSMMNTNNLNREIRKLNNHVSALKTEIAKQKNLLQEKQTHIDTLEKDKTAMEEEKESLNEKISGLEQQVKQLQSPKGSSI